MGINWSYIIEDNFLSEKHFNYVLNFSENNVEDNGLAVNKNKIWLDGKIESQLDSNFLIEFYNDYSKKLFSFLQKLAPQRIPSAKWLEINLVWTGKHTKFKIHEDSANKLLSVVIYLYPKKNTGTILYSDKLGNDKTIVDWVQNRALVFAREEGVTWHSYQGNGLSTRFALVVNIRSDV